MKQAEKTYLISDAAKRVQVESHVLRYWEEELKLPIKRNEMGHRYYTEDDIRRFQEVRDLKERSDERGTGGNETSCGNGE